jgi:signal transduction histidine kinase/CheY-like chemotaxis protein
VTDSGKTGPETTSWIKNAAFAATTAALYFFSAKICLYLAIPPGVSSVIWLPAGVALIAVTIKCAPAIAGVFTGSLLALATNPQIASTPVPYPALLTVAGGATLQAFVACRLIRSLLQKSDILRSGSSVARYYVYAGPLSCLVSPIVGCSVFSWYELIPRNLFLANFSAWWLGDTIGALVLAPFVFVLHTPTKFIRAQRIRLLLWPLIACLAVAFSIFFKARADADNDVKDDLTAMFESLIRDFERNDIRYTDLIHATKTLFTAESIPTRSQFDTYGKAMLKRYPGLEGISWVPVVSHDQREHWENAGREAGFTGFHFQATDDSGKRIPSPEKEFYRVIFYNVNASGTIRTYGFDLSSDPKRGDAMLETDRTGLPAATAMLQIIVGSSSRLRSVLYLAIRQGEMKHDMLAKNGHPTMAYIALALETDAVISGLTSAKLSKDFNLSITESGSGTVLFSWGNHQLTKESEKFSMTRSVEALTKSPWTFVMTPTEEYLNRTRSFMPWYLLIAGMLATTMANGFLLTLTGKTEAIQEEVQIRRAAESGLARTNRDLKRREQELEIAKQNAENANQAKSSFLANMSHEIRTPLAAVLGYADLLAQSPDDPERNRYRETIKRNGKMLTTIISDILDLSSIEAGKLSISPVETPLRELLADTDTIMRPTAEKKGLTYSVKKSEHLPATMITDPDRLRQILINVIGNAVKFTDRGKVTVSVDYLDAREPPLLRVRVDDTGPGIDPEKKSLLFRPFSQLDDSLNRKHGGTGLGLALSRWLARYLGGDIIQENLPEGGSRFEITVATRLPTDLPKPMAGAGQAHRAGTPDGDGIQVTLKGRHFLLVDDTDDIRTLISEFLLQKHAQVTAVASGIEALREAGRANFDAILLDLQMPVMGGFDTFEALREQAVVTPVIAITAHAGEPERRRCMDSGFSGIVTKPLSQPELMATIMQVLRS